MSMKATALRIEPIADRDFLTDFVAKRWWGEAVTIHGSLIRTKDMSALAAYDDNNELHGVATYLRHGAGLIIVTLDSLKEGGGVGSALIDAVAGLARQQGFSEIGVVAANDNLEALLFYQKRGFRIVAVWPGAIDAIRMQKPDLPIAGRHGIGMHDIIELRRVLT